ncbi:ArsI/CadI family heavy metal resistance metalloenzyme [Anatilimnocola floriformis]|uniref:ArsI/CadI family heavy metal resistance metalloenzyme n=1 Tax=Anatilimnocola floriformis TaxID=2948575 RepID=UPI0020C2BBEE|nr:ArsI/CadI family heavy metal resistance metalloenzyme [Anatilimnocola floriformis]
MTAVIPIGSCAREAVSETKQPTRFHLSLNVGDLNRAIEFFRAFFGIEPAKCRADYAKFELNDPPLVLSLEPFKATPGGNLNHLGFRMPDSAALVEVQRRLELAGISTRREEGVECCYARQTKFWVHDPDGNLWEVYTLEEDLEHRGDGHIPTEAPKTSSSVPALAIWGHRLGEPFAKRLPILDGSVDQVALQGTFNERLLLEERQRRWREIRRILKSGGEVQMHLLTANQSTDDQVLRLPGPAAAVQYVPAEGELLAELTAAGFVDVGVTFRGQSACFTAGDCQLRETRIAAKAP